MIFDWIIFHDTIFRPSDWLKFSWKYWIGFIWKNSDRDLQSKMCGQTDVDFFQDLIG